MLDDEEIEFVDPGEDDSWSASKLKTIHSCGHQFWFRYRTDIKGIQTPYLAFGKAVHKVIELVHKENNFTDEFWQESWNDQWWKYSQDVDFKGYRKMTFANSGPKMILNYVKKNKDAKILELESAFPTKDGREVYKIGPYVMRGIIDQVRRMEGGRLLVIDLKTSKYPLDPLILRADPQFTIYHGYVKEKYGEDPLLALYHLETGKMLFTERTDKDLELVQSMLTEGQAKVDQQMFQRNVTANCRYCPFFQECLGDLSVK